MAFANSVLGRQTESFQELFEMGKELGRGQFGITRECTERATGKVFACKLIAKSRLQPNDYILREVQIMHHLVGHRNVVKIKVRGKECLLPLKRVRYWKLFVLAIQVAAKCGRSS
jgi:serine/threonine protein kinase